MSKVEQSQLIQKLKRHVKEEESFLDKCKEYHENPNFVDSVHISFVPLDVSAKTVNGEIFLNENLFAEDWDTQMRYIIHELCHVLQQAAGLVSGKVSKKDYLDDKNEQEAFRTQIEYMYDHTPEEIQEYLEDLLDHHNIHGKERKEKIRELTKDI